MYVVSALGCAFCWNLESFYVFRFIGGLAIGASSVLAPMYISEIAPADRRGKLTGLFQFNIVFGILLAFLSNALVQQVAGGSDPWRIKLGVAAVPALFSPDDVHDSAESTLARSTAAAVSKASLLRWASSRMRCSRSSSARPGGAAQFRAGLFVAACKPIAGVLIAMFNQLGHQCHPCTTQGHLCRRGFRRPAANGNRCGARQPDRDLTSPCRSSIASGAKLLLIGSVGTAIALAASLPSWDQVGRAYLPYSGPLHRLRDSQGVLIWTYLSDFPDVVHRGGLRQRDTGA